MNNEVKATAEAILELPINDFIGVTTNNNGHVDLDEEFSIPHLQVMARSYLAQRELVEAATDADTTTIVLSEQLEKLLLKLVGDNVGQNCTCCSCEDNRETMRTAIRAEFDKLE